MKKLRFGIKGMSCAACVAHVEHAAEKICGKDHVNVSLMTNSMTVTVEDGTDEKKLFDSLRRSLSSAGYGLVGEQERKKENADETLKKSVRRLILSAILTALLMYIAMGSMIGLPVPSLITDHGVVFGSCQLVLALAVIALNLHFFRNGFFALFHRAPNMDSLIAIGSGASLIYGCVAIGMMAYGTHTGNDTLVHEYYHNLYFESAAMILTLVSLGKTLEGRAKAGAARAIGRLAAMMPEEANLEENGSVRRVFLHEIKEGDVILVREGETVPVDGIVIEGVASVDESAISGESIPVEKRKGDRAVAVCVLRSGYLKIRTEQVGENTTLSRMIGLLEDAASSKAPIAKIADRVSGIFVPTVITISLITAILWILVTKDIARAFSCAVSVLVISCPCALGLATPTAVMVGISRGAEKGILIKSSEALEHLHSVRYFMTDKTGTLTEGRPVVTDLVPAEGKGERELLFFAYGAEAMSTHPLASAICEKAKERGLALPATRDYASSAGFGILATVEEKQCLVGTPEFLESEGVVTDRDRLHRMISALEEEGKTAVAVAYDGALLGVIGIADALRSDSIQAIGELKKMGITPVMVTGDNERTANAVAAQCGILPEHVYAKQLPEDKERLLREYSQKGRTSMVGDGINDAPALSLADIGIAIGAGTEVAVDCADVVLSKNSLMDAVSAIDLSRATIRCIKQNLFWAMIYNTVCIPIAAGVLYPVFGIALSPMIGSAAMSMSSVCVVLNSLRLRSVNVFGDGREERKERRQKQKNEKKQEKIEKKIIEKEKNDMFGKTKTVTFGVEGMMCKNCKAHVEKALNETKGVKSSEADLERKTVTVLVKESVSEETLKAAVIAAGYQVV